MSGLRESHAVRSQTVPESRSRVPRPCAFFTQRMKNPSYFVMKPPFTTPMPATDSTTHSFIGNDFPQFPHIVVGYRAPQCGQTPSVWNVSNGCSHCAHFHKVPSGGAVRQLGQANPCRRGIFALRRSICACFSPPQQFSNMKTAISPVQTYGTKWQGRRSQRCPRS